MIKFFRQMRLSLLNQNKMGKYFKYAIGEIILVVIGILIAVQINAYVTKQNQQKENVVFLKKMIGELELNKNRMTTLTSQMDGQNWTNYENAVANCDTLLRLLYKGLKVEDIPKVASLKLTAGGSTLNAHTSIYEELLNTGKLYALGSDSLTNAIKNYYKLLAKEKIYNEANNNEVSEALDMLDNTVGKLAIDFEYGQNSFTWEDYPWLFDKNSEQYNNYQIAIFKMLKAQNNNLIKIRQVKERSEELIAIINKELNQNQ